MSRGLFDRRKDLGRPTKWVCEICGKEINAHTTTEHLATLNHLRMEKRKGLRDDYNKPIKC